MIAHRRSSEELLRCAAVKNFYSEELLRCAAVPTALRCAALRCAASCELCIELCGAVVQRYLARARRRPATNFMGSLCSAPSQHCSALQSRETVVSPDAGCFALHRTASLCFGSLRFASLRFASLFAASLIHSVRLGTCSHRRRLGRQGGVGGLRRHCGQGVAVRLAARQPKAAAAAGEAAGRHWASVLRLLRSVHVHRRVARNAFCLHGIACFAPPTAPCTCAQARRTGPRLLTFLYMISLALHRLVHSVHAHRCVAVPLTPGSVPHQLPTFAVLLPASAASLDR